MTLLGRYDDGGTERYERDSPGLPGDVEFYLGLAREARVPVLELGCGTGRVAIRLARAGISVVGLDADPAVLAVAQRDDAGVEGVRWMHADMRTFLVEDRFELVIIPYRGFLYLLTTEDQLATLAAIHRHLIPGGRLAFNIFNPAIAAIAGRRGQTSRPARKPPSGSDLGKPPLSRTHGALRLRYVSREEMERLLLRSGFEIEALYGWFDRRPFDKRSTEMVWIARKADGSSTLNPSKESPAAL